MKEILIYGTIGWEVMPLDIERQLTEAGGDDVLIRIHSDGGSVHDGNAMLAMLRNYGGDVSVRVDGVAFSMAAVIALEFQSSLSMHDDGWLMFHEVSGGGGQVADLERQVEMIKAMNEVLVQKLTPFFGDETAERLNEEIWINGKQAHELGIVAELLPSQALAAHVSEGVWKNAPAALCAAQPTKNKHDSSNQKLVLVRGPRGEA